jgi:ABC-type antimicrobial peptide transport system permease subunit
LREDDRPILYVPLWQAALRRPAGQLVVRSSVRSELLVPSLRQTFGSINPKMRYSFRPLDEVIRGSLLRERLMAALAGPFGLLAIILTALGLYGVFSYLVSQRTKEIGIRIALGADRRRVINPILREAAVVLSIGLSAGVLLTLIAGRTASALLFGVTSHDPLTIAIAAASVAWVALLASYLPARRASRVDPAIALRHE